MFRKLVSSLPFSPALVGHISFYAKRLRKEQSIRRLGLIFTALALMVQSFAVFAPPEQALADNTSDVIPGGIRSPEDALAIYDAGVNGQNDFDDLLGYFGITKQELATMQPEIVYVCSNDPNIVAISRQQHFSASDGELTHSIPLQTGGVSTFYSIPLLEFDTVNEGRSCYEAYAGQSEQLGWFAIAQKSGGLHITHAGRKVPRGHLVSASCQTVQGFAYDEREPDKNVNVYLYFGGPPGKGKQYGPIASDQMDPAAPPGPGHGFHFAVPQEYQDSSSPTEVWGVMQPLHGWGPYTVQFDNTLTIPAECTSSGPPAAQCLDLRVGIIERTQFVMTASAHADQGANIEGYTFKVADSSGNNVYENSIDSTAAHTESGPVALTSPGEYTASVVVNTSNNDNFQCSKPLTVSPPGYCQYNSATLATDPACQPCPYDSSVWANDTTQCRAQLSQSKEVHNLSQGDSNAHDTTANPADRLEYTIYTTNIGNSTLTVPIEDDLTDALQYTSLVEFFESIPTTRLLDPVDGMFDSDKRIISWGEVTLGPQQTDTRSYILQVDDAIPATPRGANDPAAYNCLVTNSHGNTTSVHVACPFEKTVEGIIKQLPFVSQTTNVVFGTIVLVIVTFLYARSRQLNKELRLIRKDFNTGTM